MDPINGLGMPAGAGPDGAQRAPGAPEASSSSFATLVENTMEETERLQTQADAMVKSFAQGEITDVHQVMLAMNRADLSFRMMIEVRNKLLDAYQEVMRMQV